MSAEKMIQVCVARVDLVLCAIADAWWHALPLICAIALVLLYWNARGRG